MLLSKKRVAQKMGNFCLTLTLLTWTIWRAPTDASKWRMGFHSAFKGLIIKHGENFVTFYSFRNRISTGAAYDTQFWCDDLYNDAFSTYTA